MTDSVCEASNVYLDTNKSWLLYQKGGLVHARQSLYHWTTSSNQKAILWGEVHPAVFGNWILGLFSSCSPEASEAEKGPDAAAQLEGWHLEKLRRNQPTCAFYDTKSEQRMLTYLGPFSNEYAGPEWREIKEKSLGEPNRSLWYPRIFLKKRLK